MRIREKHVVYDQMKLFLILVLLLVAVLSLAVLKTVEGKKHSSMEKFLLTALKPVGTTMYIWGGGWDNEDGKAGASSTRIGLSSDWEKYAARQTSDYSFEEHKWEQENGLDCSGYVGWVLYNTFEKRDGEPGYVMKSTDMAQTYAKWGFGKWIQHPTDFLPGDIVSMEGHVWISLGTCVDGSVLFVHSSPPGVSVCGTAIHETKSIAIQLAEKFMAAYYPDWHKRYPNCEKPASYLENVNLMRWNEQTLKGAKEIQALSGEEVLEYLIRNLTLSVR